MRLLVFVILFGMLSGCFVSNPYKKFSTEKAVASDECQLSAAFRRNEAAYSCLFMESIKKTGSVSQYLLLSGANQVDFNSALDGSEILPKGLQSVALPVDSPIDLEFVVVGVRNGFGWAPIDRVRIFNFTPVVNKHYIARMKFFGMYKFSLWIEEADTGKVVAGQRD